MQVSRDLKSLREQTSPRLSIRRLASLLGLSPSAYHAYESEKRFKQRFLPMELAIKLASIFSQHGISPDRVMALAAPKQDSDTASIITSQELKMLQAYRRLNDSDQLTIFNITLRISQSLSKQV